MILYHTPSGKYWHMDKECRRVLQWQLPRLKPFEVATVENIETKYRCRGCWR